MFSFVLPLVFTRVPPSTIARRTSEFELANAAVAAVASIAADGSTSIVLTTFAPFASDGIYAVLDASTLLSPEPSNVTTITKQVVWPNQADSVPAGVAQQLGMRAAILSAGGFFPNPEKATGRVQLHDVSALPAVTSLQISTDKSSYFYHHAEWVAGRDGNPVVLAARAIDPTLPWKHAAGELVVLEQPSVAGGAWTETVVAAGPDVAFTLTDLDGPGAPSLVAAQYFSAKQLTVWSCGAPSWALCAGGVNVSSMLIDDAEGAGYFNVQWVDLNGDGRKCA